MAYGPPKYGIRTPPFMPYEPFLLGVGVVFNLLTFCNAPGGGAGSPGWCWGWGPRAQGGEGGAPSKRHLVPDPHLGALDLGMVVTARVSHKTRNSPEKNQVAQK